MATNTQAPITAVGLDLRGTMTTECSGLGWMSESLRRAGRPAHERAAAELRATIDQADRGRLKATDNNTSPKAHRECFYAVFRDAGLDEVLCDALWEVDSDLSLNVFAVDVAETLRALRERGCALAVLSNIHLDIRPLLADAGILDLFQVLVLSGECGVQKPDPAFYRTALELMNTPAEQMLMVGDRSSRDGVAVELGMPTLLLPQLTDPRHRRLHMVTALVDASRA